jgi:hypothetical protein
MSKVFPALFILTLLTNIYYSQETSQNQEIENFSTAISYSSGEINELYIPAPNITPYSVRTAVFDIDYVSVPADVQAVVDFAASVWHTALNATIPITIKVKWEPLGCNGGICTLGSTSINLEGLGGGLGNDPYDYPTSLANQLDNTDYSWSSDIVFTLNSDYPNFYKGIDGDCDSTQIDLVTITLHEIGHGLGFASGVWSGLGFTGFGSNFYNTFIQIGDAPGGTAMDAVSWSTSVESDNLFWNGANTIAANNGSMPAIYAPNPYEGGSSISHFDPSSPSITANILMRPGLSDGQVIHSPSVLDMALLEDMGWVINCIFDGCTDPVACNFDPNACNDDGSCIQPEWYLPNIVGGGHAILACSYISGYSKAINQSCAADVIASDSFCLSTSWDPVCQDAYECCSDIQNHGCTELYACNYDSTACWDDGSCIYCAPNYSCFNVTFTGPENILIGTSGSWTLTGSDGVIEESGSYSFGISGGVSSIPSSCVPDDCYTFEVQEASEWSLPVSWSLGFDSNTYSSEGASGNTLSFASASASGCMDPIACNYDASLCFDDGSCNYQDILTLDLLNTTWYLESEWGCNTFFPETINSFLFINGDNTFYTSSGYQGVWSNCFNTITFLYDDGTVYNGSLDFFTVQISGTMNNPSGILFNSGCFIMNQATPGCLDDTACNYDINVTHDDGSCTFPGCSDINACNYFVDAGCLEDCVYPLGQTNQVLGCTYPTAVNYDPTATIDNGTCMFDLIDPGMCGTGTYFDVVEGMCLPDGTGSGVTCMGDLDGDGFVNTNDLLSFLSVFGSTCP